MSRSISKGSCPKTHSAKPQQILCDRGASMMALATREDESTSPIPQMPASVCTLTTSVSWLPSQRSLTSGKRRWMASMLVIFMVEYLTEFSLRHGFEQAFEWFLADGDQAAAGLVQIERDVNHQG